MPKTPEESFFTHDGTFGNSPAGRLLALGFIVDLWGTRSRLQGVRVRGAETESPHIRIRRGGESFGIPVRLTEEDRALLPK